MQKLPLGIQDFSKLRRNDLLYVDKTELIYKLIQQGQYYFLSRPRRFGKSLLLSTLYYIFSGQKELFKGLWIEDKLDWEEYNAIHLSFGNSSFKTLGLEKAIEIRLKEVAESHDLQIQGASVGEQFKYLIKALSQEKQVVILIDEYDKPIIEYLGKTELPKAHENRDILKSFYSILKDLDAHIRFLFITGVSKFSKVSIFSDLNNLADISITRSYATLLGYTQSELESYFQAHLKKIIQEQDLKSEDLIKTLKHWYNGYDFAGLGNEKVYNPFSILSYMEFGQVSNYWFSTGTPTFLTKKMKEEDLYQLEDIEADEIGLSKSNIENIDIVSLLFQTGYLSIKSKIDIDIFALDYPNQEVRNAMLRFLLVEYSGVQDSQAKPLVHKIKRAFAKNDLELVFEHLNTLFAKIPYQIFEEKRESYYHSIIFLAFTMLGYYTSAEVQTSKGRIDTVVETEDNIYILEFKVNDSAENALAQIKKQAYFQKYKDAEKPIYLIGVACKDKELKDYLVEKI